MPKKRQVRSLRGRTPRRILKYSYIYIDGNKIRNAILTESNHTASVHEVASIVQGILRHPLHYTRWHTRVYMHRIIIYIYK